MAGSQNCGNAPHSQFPYAGGQDIASPPDGGGGMGGGTNIFGGGGAVPGGGGAAGGGPVQNAVLGGTPFGGGAVGGGAVGGGPFGGGALAGGGVVGERAAFGQGAFQGGLFGTQGFGIQDGVADTFAGTGGGPVLELLTFGGSRLDVARYSAVSAGNWLQEIIRWDARRADVAEESFWRGIVDRQPASGLSFGQSCRCRRLSKPRFCWWRKAG